MASATDKTVTVTMDPTATSKQSDVIPGATTNKAGVMTAAQAARLELATAESIELWVDPNGNDANSGTSPDQPLRTVKGVFDKMPGILRGGPNIVHFAAGDIECQGMDYSPPAIVGANFDAAVRFIGAEADQLGGSQIAEPGSDANTYVVTGPVVADDSLRGATLTDEATGESALVTGNTTLAGVLTINVVKTNFPPPSTVGNSFRVVRPGTVFKVPQFAPAAFVGIMGLFNIKFQSEAEPGFPIPLAVFPRIAFLFVRNVEFDGGTSGRGMILLHTSRITWDRDQGRRAGIYSHAASPFQPCDITITDRCSFDPTIVADNIFVDCDFFSSMISPLDLRNADCFYGEVASIIIRGKIDGSLGFLPGAVWGVFGVQIEIFGDFDVSNAAFDGVNIDNGSLLVDGGANFSGTGNGGVGLNVQNGGYAQVVKSGANATMTGAGGDVTVGGSTVAWAALSPTGVTDINTLDRAQ